MVHKHAHRNHFQHFLFHLKNFKRKTTKTTRWCKKVDKNRTPSQEQVQCKNYAIHSECERKIKEKKAHKIGDYIKLFFSDATEYVHSLHHGIRLNKMYRK